MISALKAVLNSGVRASALRASGVSRHEVLNALCESIPTTGLCEETLQLMRTIPSMGLSWSESGFPCVTPGHKLAASLMCTSVATEHLKYVALPWRCFFVECPDKVLSGNKWHIFMLAATDGLYKTHVFEGARHVAAGQSSDIEAFANLNAHEGSESAFMHRLLLGACLEMDSDVHHQSITLGKKSRRYRSGPPSEWVYRLTRNVTVDCRDFVRMSLAGNGKPLSIQTLVRGHHRRQTYADGQKWVHIEPYWRGPEECPIAVRDHTL